MTSESSNCAHSMHEGVRWDGTNTGASLSVHHYPRGTPVDGCCCINIYVNNNVQGVNNSLVFGSKVIMRDPGVRLLFRQGRRSKGEMHASDIEDRAANVSSPVEFGLYVMLAMLFVFILSIICNLSI